MTAAPQTAEIDYAAMASERAALTDEHWRLGHIGHKQGGLDGEMRERWDAVNARLRELVAIPPQGWAYPKAAAELVAHARAHGWQVLAEWLDAASRGADPIPYLNIKVGRAGEDGGGFWKYQACWHSYNVERPRTLRLFGRILAQDPDRRAPHDARSLREVREAIAAHPVRR
jgi:hypothetical protein